MPDSTDAHKNGKKISKQDAPASDKLKKGDSRQWKEDAPADSVPKKDGARAWKEDASLPKKKSVAKKVADRMDVTCDRCGRLMRPGGVIQKTFRGEDYQYCSQNCANLHLDKMRVSEGRGYWKEKADQAPSGGRTLAMILIVLIVAIVAAIVLASVALKPPPKQLYADLSVTTDDVKLYVPHPSGDNKTAILPVSILIENKGEGISSTINVWCAAYNVSQPNLVVSEFNTTQLLTVPGGEAVTVVAPAGQKGCIVNASGILTLPPDTYRIKVQIFEDAKRTLVSGFAIVKVDKTSVTVPAPYVPEGGSHGRSYPAPASKSSIPGFDAVLALPAIAIAVVLLRKARHSRK